MEKMPKRIPSLDGLRTISIVLVVVGHLFHVLGFGSFGNLGNLGVRVFFVISGFLITGILMKEIEKTTTVNLARFYFRRTLRIFPPYYFYLFVMLSATLFGVAAIPLKSLFYASVYATNYFNPASWNLGHTWSLAVEEQFYLIFPGVLLILGLRKTKLFLLFLVAVSPLIRIAEFEFFGAEPIWIIKGFHANLDALGIGCLLALFYTHLHQTSLYRKFLASKIVVLFPFVILLFNFQSEHPLLFLGVSFSVMNLLIALCIDWSVTNYETIFGRLLNSAPMVTLGTMSYSIYLWQQPFFNPDNPNILTQTPFNFIGLVVMTIISYYFVEKYSLKLRQKLEVKFFDKKPLTETAQLLKNEIQTS